jgi:hypothetical protein
VPISGQSSRVPGPERPHRCPPSGPRSRGWLTSPSVMIPHVMPPKSASERRAAGAVSARWARG